MTRPEESPGTPIFDAVAALLAECPLSGPIDPQREPELFEGVGEDAVPESPMEDR